MGTIKKYHFVLYISEEQEFAIRQLFLINKWDLHGKALSQLAAALEAAQNDLANSTHTVQDTPAHQLSVQNVPTPQLPVQHSPACQLSALEAAQNDLTNSTHRVQDASAHQLSVPDAPTLQLPVQNDSYQQLSVQSGSFQQIPVQYDSLKQLPVQNASTALSLGTANRNKHDPEQVLSQSIEEIEYEAFQHVGSSSHDTVQNVNNVSDMLKKQDSNSISILKKTVSDSPVTSSDVMTTCVGNSNSIQMDPLARASEIAGIPFQQPDGSLYYSPNSEAYQRYENFYQHNQVPVHTDQQQSAVAVDQCSQALDSIQREQQQALLDSVNTTSQSHGSGIDQLIRASAVVPTQDTREYSSNDQGYQNPTTVSSSLSATEIQLVQSQLPVSSPITFTAHKFEANKDSAGTFVTELSGSQCNINKTDSLSVTSKSVEVSGTDVVVTESFGKEEIRISDLHRNSNNIIQREEITPSDALNKQSNISETFSANEEHIGSSTKKDFVELNVKGSVVKIPVIKTNIVGNVKEDITQGESESEDILQQTSLTEEIAVKQTPFTEEVEKQSKQKQVNVGTEPNVNSPVNIELNVEKNREPEETKRTESKELISENEEVRLEQEVNSKRKKRLTGEHDKVSKKQRTEINVECRKNSNDNMQQTSKKHVKQINGEKNENKTADQRNKQLTSEVTKTYSTRFRTKKEMTENSKKKRDRVKKHQDKKSKSEREDICKKTIKDSKNKKNKLLKHENIPEKASAIVTSDKEVNAKEGEDKNKARSRKSKPKRRRVEAAEKLPESIKDQVLSKEQSDIEDHETDLIKDAPESVEVKEEAEIKSEIKDANNSKPKKFTKLKPSKPKDENDDISTIKCVECGNFCNKKGYCKVCRVSCPHCEKTFTKCPSAMKLYQTHVKKHMDDPKPYPCTECEMKFSSQWFLNRHLENKHVNQSSSGPFQCEVCQKRFTTKYSLKGHLSHVHGDRKRDVLCDLCGDFFLSQGYLRQHRQYVHQEERNFTCHLCYVSVKTEVLLKRHLARHTEEKNEVCNICGRSFRVRSDLLRHMVRHDSNRRSFKCETCGKGFFEDQKLKQHVRIHTGVKPFKCNLCPYACAVKGNLTKHLKTHANREGYLGRSYKRKSKLSKTVNQLITDPIPVQMQIEVITANNDHITLTQENLPFERGEQELSHFDTHKHDLPQYESGKQELPYVEMAGNKEELVPFETSKEKLPHFETGKQEVSQFESGKEDLPHFETVKQSEAQFETLRDSVEHGRDHYETVRTDTNPVRVYYEAVHPDYIEAGRPYLTQQGMKDYKEIVEGDYKEMDEGEYINQINAVIANNYKNVNKIDFYNM